MKLNGWPCAIVAASHIFVNHIAYAGPLAPSVEPADVIAGKAKMLDQRCDECHGVDGNGERPERKYAKLAGQTSAYMIKQLRDYRSGARKHDFMTMLVSNLEDRDIVDISAYYASLPAMHGDGSDDSVGKSMFVNGDAGRNILPCGSCHGVNQPAGVNAAPVIAGQEAAYLAEQLQAWRSGERSNSAAGVMNLAARSLTDAEIAALAEYVAGLGRLQP